MRRLLWAVLALLLLPVSARATINTFFVNNVTGSDANDGTAATTGGGHGPWATLNHAQSSLTVGSTGTIVTVAATATPYAETNCFSSIAFCFSIGGTSNSARVAFVCSQNWVFGSTQGCLMEMQFEVVDINFFDFGAIGSGFDVGGPSGMPNNQSAINVINSSSSNGNSIHFLGNYFHDFGQNVVFGGITGCIDAGMVAYGGSAGENWSPSDFEVIGNFLNNYGIVGNGCNNAEGIYPAQGAPSSGPTIIWNNLVMNISTHGIHYYHSPCNAYIANNTVLHVGGFGVLIAAGSGDTCSADGAITLANNILDNNLSGPIRFGAGSTGISCAANSILVRNNLYNGNGNSNAIFGSGTCTQVIGNLTSEASSATFSNYQVNGSGTYTLKLTSVARGGGTSTCVTGQTGCIPTTTFTGAAQTSPPVIGAFLAASGGTPSYPTNFVIAVKQ